MKISAVIFFFLFLGLVNQVQAYCKKEDVNNSCRYPTGDQWCLENDGNGNRFAYKGNCSEWESAADTADTADTGSNIFNAGLTKNIVLLSFTIVLLIIAIIFCTSTYIRSLLSFNKNANDPSLTEIPIGLGLRRVFWGLNEGVIITKRKAISKVFDDSNGGSCIINTLIGESVYDRVDLRERLFEWNDEDVLTADGIPAEIAISLMWKVIDVKKYVYNTRGKEINNENNENHDILAIKNWVKSVAEADLRQLISTFKVLHLVDTKGVDATSEPDKLLSIECKLIKLIRPELEKYGVFVTKLKFTKIIFPEEIQRKINTTIESKINYINSYLEGGIKANTMKDLVDLLGVENAVLVESQISSIYPTGLVDLNFPFRKRLSSKYKDQDSDKGE